MHCAYLIRSQELVELLLERKCRGSFIVAEDTEFVTHAAPGELFFRDFVIAAAGDDVVEDLEEVEIDGADFGVGVEVGATGDVVVLDALDKGVVFFGVVDLVSGDLINGGHDGGSRGYGGLRPFAMVCDGVVEGRDAPRLLGRLGAEISHPQRVDGGR